MEIEIIDTIAFFLTKYTWHSTNLSRFLSHRVMTKSRIRNSKSVGVWLEISPRNTYFLQKSQNTGSSYDRINRIFVGLQPLTLK